MQVLSVDDSGSTSANPIFSQFQLVSVDARVIGPLVQFLSDT